MASGRTTKTPWDEVRKDFIRGMTVAELSDKYKITDNSIYQRSWKEDWKALIKHAKEQAHKAIEDIIEQQKLIVSQTLQDEIDRWQNKIKEVNGQILSKVEELLPGVDKMDAAQKAAGAVAQLDATVRRSMGLDDKVSDGSRINLTLVGRIDDILAGQAAKPANVQVTDSTAGLPVDYQAGKQGQVIDVQTSPIL